VGFVTAFLLALGVGIRVWHGLRWRIQARASDGVSTLRAAVTPPVEADLRIQLVPLVDRGTQRLVERP
jgi:hypothetical protein